MSAAYKHRKSREAELLERQTCAGAANSKFPPACVDGMRDDWRLGWNDISRPFRRPSNNDGHFIGKQFTKHGRGQRIDKRQPHASGRTQPVFPASRISALYLRRPPATATSSINY